MDTHGLYDKVRLPTDSPEWIRLLQIKNDTDHENVRCSLHAVPLADAPAYTALSYSWHSALEDRKSHWPEIAEESFEIECNGEKIAVYQNLYQALLRLGREPYASRVFWIDALCINQSDLEERNRQVNIMPKIYSQAEQVIIWLGPEDEHSSKALDLIEVLCGLTNDQRRRIDYHSLGTPEVNCLLEPVYQTEKYWVSLEHFFRRDWFSRAFVICGDNKCSWEGIEVIADYLARSSWKAVHRSLIRLGARGDGVSPYVKAAKLASARRSVKERHDDLLLNTLIRARGHDSENPKDKVFGVCGIARMYAPKDVHVIMTDYSLSLLEVLTKATINVLESSSDFHVLAHAEGSRFRSLEGLPSWIVDWSVINDVGLGVTGYKRYSAAGDLSSVFEVVYTSRVLLLQAAYIARISISDEPTSSAQLFSSLPKLIQILRSMDDTYHTGESNLEVFWRTLISNTDPHERTCPAPDRLRRSFLVYVQQRARLSDRLGVEHDWNTLEALCRPLWASDPLSAGTASNATATKETNKQTWASGEAADFALASSHNPNLVLFRTEEGYLGRGTISLHEGDSIWIVPGSRVPLILREKPGTLAQDGRCRYELVGGTYLHGFMHGEALRKSLDLYMIEVE